MGERSRQYVIVFGTLALMSIEGYSNVTKQHKIVGEFSNYPLETLVDWKESGRIRYIGITTSSTSQFAEMELLMKTTPVDFIQVNYSLDSREAEDRLLPLALDSGIAVMVNRPFSRGRLFAAFSETDLPDWANEMGCTSWAQFFLKYVVSHPAVTCSIPGTTKERHVRDNMLANFGELPDKAMRVRQEKLLASL